jgi:hypothetical protein
MRTASSFVGTASIRLGIYNNTSNAPGTVLLDAGLIAPIAASAQYNITTISQSLTPGIYWLAMNTITAATTNNFEGYSIAAIKVNNYDMGTAGIGSAAYSGYFQSVNVTSGFATASASIQSGVVPIIALGL